MLEEGVDIACKLFAKDSMSRHKRARGAKSRSSTRACDNDVEIFRSPGSSMYRLHDGTLPDFYSN